MLKRLYGNWTGEQQIVVNRKILSPKLRFNIAFRLEERVPNSDEGDAMCPRKIKDQPRAATR